MAYIGKQNIFINNKYKLWHDKIIAKAKNRTLEGYKEVHHIIPKSCGGSNDKDNLIALTAREHYIIHMLLPFCVTKEYKFKMIKGFLYMNVKTKSQKRFYKINSRMYQKFRIEYGILNKGYKHTEETKMKMKGRILSNETKEKIKYARQFQVYSDEQRKKYSEIYSNSIWVNKDNKSKRIQKESKQEYLNNGYKLGRDMSHMTNETRNLLSQRTKAYWERRVA
jgi:hypothetical protein